MYHTTGFTKAEITELCARIWSPRAFAKDAQMAADTRAAQCAHRNLDLSAAAV